MPAITVAVSITYAITAIITLTLAVTITMTTIISNWRRGGSRLGTTHLHSQESREALGRDRGSLRAHASV